MSDELNKKVKTALDETRLLILGVQVLLGFAFQSFFQDGFAELSATSKLLCAAGVSLVILSTGVLVIPSMEHRLVELDGSSVRLLKVASSYAGLGLAPLVASLGLSAFIVIDRHFGMVASVAVALLLAGFAAFAWFGLELLIGTSKGARAMKQSATPLETRIQQLLTEARGHYSRRTGPIRIPVHRDADHRRIGAGLVSTRILLLAHWASDVAVGLAIGALTERLLRFVTGFGR